MALANYVDLGREIAAQRAAHHQPDANLTGIDEPERVAGFRVTPSYFHLLGVRPTIGRPFNDEDARYTESPSVVIISDGLWHRRFGADTGVLGRVVRINDVPRTIVGVMPAGFVFPPGAELWSPLSLAGDYGRERDGRFLRGVLARLKPGVSLARAVPTSTASCNNCNANILRRRQVGHARRRRERVLRTAPAAVHARPARRGDARPAHRVRERCQLALARATTRTREVAVRVALGASRGRIVRHHLAESLLLAVAGGLLGILFAVWGIEAVRAMLPPEQARLNPGWTRMELSAGVLGVTAAVSFVTAMLVGLAPAFVASGADPRAALTEGGRGAVEAPRHRLRGLLVRARWPWRSRCSPVRS
jgi:putative ABC transport system permease protein